MKQKGRIGAGFLGIFLCVSAAMAQEPEPVSLSEIHDDPTSWRGTRIEVEGDVTEISQLAPRAVFYRLTDLAGRSLWIKRETADQHDHPALHQTARAIGVLQRNVGTAVPDAKVILIEDVAVASVESGQAEVRPGLREILRREPVIALLVALFALLSIALLVFVWWSRKPTVVAEADTKDRPIASLVSEPSGPDVRKLRPTQYDTPIYTGRPIGKHDLRTPLYLGRLVVKDCVDNALVGRTYDLKLPPGKEEAVLGRGSGADIEIPYEFLSRKQLLLRADGEGLIATRARASKKVEVDGRAIQEGESFRLDSGAVLAMQAIVLEFERS